VCDPLKPLNLFVYKIRTSHPGIFFILMVAVNLPIRRFLVFRDQIPHAVIGKGVLALDRLNYLEHYSRSLSFW